ncbi:hypothetical protein M1146_07290, partial [Patescibacteria group bacterium]|nr:hypothetical protein [Patescibacteria group bacterium]
NSTELVEGDRVVSLRSSNFGSIGTVVASQDNMVFVVFDHKFIGGTDLGGLYATKEANTNVTRCTIGLGLKMERQSLLLIPCPFARPERPPPLASATEEINANLLQDNWKAPCR